MTANTGADVFNYTTVLESSGISADTITGFDYNADVIQIATTMTTTGFDAGTADATVVGFSNFNASTGVITVLTDQGTMTLNTATSTNAPGASGSMQTSPAIGYTLTGTTGDDTIVTGAGADTITGGAGADAITGGTGNDVFSFNATDSAAVVVTGGTVSDIGADTINDFASGDLIQVTGELADGFNVANDVLVGDGTALDDNGVLFDDYATNTYLVDRAGTATVFETVVNVTSDGTTAAFADAAAAQAATVFNVTLAAAGATVTLGANNDTVIGGTGDDTINGGAGADTITGGLGADIIVPGFGIDTVILTEGVAAVDSVTLSVATADRDNITGFATTSDKLVVTIAAFDAAVTGTPFATIGAGATAGVEFVTVADATALLGGTVVGATNTNGILHLQDTGDIYLNIDGATAGGLILIGNIGAASTLAATDFTLV